MHQFIQQKLLSMTTEWNKGISSIRVGSVYVHDAMPPNLIRIMHHESKILALQCGYAFVYVKV